MVSLVFSDLLETNQFPFFVLVPNRRQMLIESRFLAEDPVFRYIRFINDNEIISETDVRIDLVVGRLDN